MRQLLLVCVLVACGPGRQSFSRYPGAPAAFDRAGSDPKALEIADKVFAAAGGPGNWDKAKQIRWRQTVTADGKVTVDGEQAWDRWNGRHYGRLKREASWIIVAYELYGNFAMGFAEEGKRKQNFDESTRKQFVNIARDGFNVTTAVLAMPFLMFEPGAKLSYVGQATDEAGGDHYDQIKVTFAEPLRKDLEFHTIIDRNTNLPQRIEIIKAGTTEKIGYTLKDWTTVSGLKFASSRGNMGYSGETIAIKDIKVGDVEDTLYIAPVE